MLLFREKIPVDWLMKVLANLPAGLVDLAQLEKCCPQPTGRAELHEYRGSAGPSGFAKIGRLFSHLLFATRRRLQPLRILLVGCLLRHSLEELF